MKPLSKPLHWPPAMNTQPLLSSINPLPFLVDEPSNQIVITIGNRQLEIPFEKVVFLEGCGNYTYLYTTDGKRHLSSKTLKWFWALLDHTHFVRIHKSSIVNWSYLRGFSDCERAVKLHNGREISISRRRVREVKALASSRGI